MATKPKLAIDRILSDAERAKIESFCKDSIMFNAVKKVLMIGAHENGVMKEGEAYDATQNFALNIVFSSLVSGKTVTDEELGQTLRASAVAMRLVEQGFGQLEGITTGKKPGGKKPEDPAE